MIFTPTIQKGIQFATEAHAGQMRKGKDIPYITHPLTVAVILSQAGASEDVIIAGLLHDVVEDCDVELDDVRNEFGSSVVELVRSVTEEDKSLPWEERKRIALAHIKDMSHDALLLKSADVLHNLSELVHDVEEQGDVVFEKFNAPKEKKLKQQQKLLEAFKKAWPENLLLNDIQRGVELLVELSGQEEPLVNEGFGQLKVVSVDCDSCGLSAGFEHDNRTFFYCVEHKFGVNISSGQFAKQQMCRPCDKPLQRYDLVDEDNVCPICQGTLSVTYAPRKIKKR